MEATERRKISPRSRFGSLRDFDVKYPTERSCRAALEKALWPHGPVCPECGSLDAYRLRDRRGKKPRIGVRQCKDCGKQFTVTAGTPLHSTKLPVRKWLLAIHLIFGSSKGVSSVVLARQLGVCQKTAWKVGHAVREMLEGREDVRAQLQGIVEVDTSYVGGAPKRIKHVWNPPGKGTSKQPVMIMTQREGPTRMQTIKGEASGVVLPVLQREISKEAILMTDGDKALVKSGKQFAEHHHVRHSQKEYAVGDVHINRAEGYAGLLRRSVQGVYHYLSQEHLQRYLNEMAFRWSRRQLHRLRSSNGKIIKVLAVLPFETHLAELMQNASGRRLHYDRYGGIRRVNEHVVEPFDPYAPPDEDAGGDGADDDGKKPASTAEMLAIIRAGRTGEF